MMTHFNQRQKKWRPRRHRANQPRTKGVYGRKEREEAKGKKHILKVISELLGCAEETFSCSCEKTVFDISSRKVKAYHCKPHG